MRVAAVWFPAAPDLAEVLWAMEDITPQIEIARDDLLLFAARGPARYYGGELALTERVEEALVELAPGARIGIADGPFAAEFAAYQQLVVESCFTADFVGKLPVGVFSETQPELVELLVRLGIHHLAEFAALPVREVRKRFGPEAALAHRLARGEDERLITPAPPPLDFEVVSQLDVPIERVDSAAFVAKALAEDLHDRLTHAGLTCAQLVIEATTETGQQHVRTWRHDGALSANDIADRVRWQLDGWLSGTSGEAKPTAGITVIRLLPDQLKRGGDNQSALWGKSGAEDARMGRVLARVQGILGPQAVLTAVVGGGRDPVERITWVTWGEPREARLPSDQPWPGQLPQPSPTVVHFDPLPAQLLDAVGAPVIVNRRLAVSGAPAVLRIGGAQHRLIGWAGPWPVEEHWWDPSRHRRRARMQLESLDGRAWLVAQESGGWWVEGSYD